MLEYYTKEGFVKDIRYTDDEYIPCQIAVEIASEPQKTIYYRATHSRICEFAERAFISQSKIELHGRSGRNCRAEINAIGFGLTKAH